MPAPGRHPRLSWAATTKIVDGGPEPALGLDPWGRHDGVAVRWVIVSADWYYISPPDLPESPVSFLLGLPTRRRPALAVERRVVAFLPADLRGAVLAAVERAAVFREAALPPDVFLAACFRGADFVADFDLPDVGFLDVGLADADLP